MKHSTAASNSRVQVMCTKPQGCQALGLQQTTHAQCLMRNGSVSQEAAETLTWRYHSNSSSRHRLACSSNQLTLLLSLRLAPSMPDLTLASLQIVHATWR